MLDRERADDVGAGGAVHVQDVEAVAGCQADVGLGPLGPPGQDAGPVAGGVGEAVGDQAAEGMLAYLGQIRSPQEQLLDHAGVVVAW